MTLVDVPTNGKSLASAGHSVLDHNEQFRFTPTGLIVTGEPNFDTWEQMGQQLQYIEGAVHWWIGDWLNYGERRWGEMYSQALEETGLKYQTLANDKWVAGKIDFSVRTEKLDFRKYEIIAGLDDPEARHRWINIAAEENLTHRDLRHRIRRNPSGIESLQEPPSLTGKYRIIYADPPWKYGNDMPNYFTEQADHYPLMTVLEVAEMPIVDIAEDDAVLFLWVTSPILEESFQVINAWGFEYKSSFVWDKVKHNMGHYNSVRHEFLFVCTRGSCQPDVQKLFDSVQIIERSDTHSEKPEEFRQIIDTIYPHGERIELFARKQVDGWKRHGNECIPGLEVSGPLASRA